MKKHYCYLPLPLRCVISALLFLATIGYNRASAQGCNPDTIPPVAVCKSNITVKILADDPSDCYGPGGYNNVPAAFGPNEGAGVAWVNASDLDEGSFDACGSNLKFTIRRIAPFSNSILGLNPTNGHPPCNDNFPDAPSEFETAISEAETLKIYSREVNTGVAVEMRVYQLNANGTFATYPSTGAPIYTSCYGTINVEDKQAPTCTPPPPVTVSCEQFDPSLLAYGAATVTDNACIDTVLNVKNYSNFDTVCNKGTLLRIFKAFDCSGNSSQCSQTIVVNYEQNYFVKFPNDLILPQLDANGNYGQPSFYGEDCELIGVSFEDQFFINQPSENIRLERTWTIINWCTYDPAQGGITVPNPQPNADINHGANLPGPIVSAPGTQPPWQATVVKVDPNDAAPTDYATFWDANVNFYKYKQIIRVIDSLFIGVSGKVFSDEQDNCNYQTGEPGLPGWAVELTGLNTGTKYVINADNDGMYTAVFSMVDSLVKVRLLSSINVGPNCPPDYIVHGITGNTVTQNVPVHLNTSCKLLSVSIGAPTMRRCFTNRYQVKACNISTQDASNVYVDVDLDNYLSFESSSIPGVSQGNNRYRFQIGDLHAGDCLNFWIDFNASCAAPLGATHCTSASIYPTDDCRDNSNWTGADVEVTAHCDADSVRLRISNAGNGAMAQTLNYVVVEDIIMRQTGGFQLAPDENLELAFPADGSTWRLEAPQEPYHPFPGIQSTALEGCGGIHTFGLVNQFPLQSNSPFIDRNCQQNYGSIDPNDKQAFPVGFGSEHYIKPNTDIKYMIRFQNTGTDTAFNIVVLDTLSNYLDATSVRTGTASHDMNFSILDGNVLRFEFPNIMLPDSNINEAASHGFVEFLIKQKPDLPENSRIENNAAIYFDFNTPVFTNTTFHVVRDHLMASVSTRNIDNQDVMVFPNPTRDAAMLEFFYNMNNAQFVLKNQIGQPIRSDRFSGERYHFNRGNLTAGVYFFEIHDPNGKSLTGKIIIQ